MNAWPAVSTIALLLCTGCVREQPRLMQGDRDGAYVEYVHDLAGAAAIAKRHCAQYERVAHYIDSAQNVAHFTCLPR